MPRLRWAAALVAALVLALVAPATADVDPPPVDTDVDYQLGGATAMPAHVGIVVRDRRAAPADGPLQRLLRQRLPDPARRARVLEEADAAGAQARRPAGRRRGVGRVAARHPHAGEAAGAGPDRRPLDRRGAPTTGSRRWSTTTSTRSRAATGCSTRRHAIAFARLLVRRAHAADLAVGQKNLAGFDGSRVGFDFAVAEECARYRECQRYVASYGRRVLVIEYRKRDFRRACRTARRPTWRSCCGTATSHRTACDRWC